MSEHSWYKIVEARKDHKCVICKQVISKGTNYVSCAELEDGSFKNYKMHEACEDKLDDYLLELSEKVWAIEGDLGTARIDTHIDVEKFYKDESGDLELSNE